MDKIETARFEFLEQQHINDVAGLKIAQVEIDIWKNRCAEQAKIILNLKAQARDILTDALHPEFGSEWIAPDGELHKAFIMGMNLGVTK